MLAACGTMHSSVVVEPAAGGNYSSGNVVTPAAQTSIPGGSYQVVKGDTLYSIAFRNKVDFRDLAQWNGVAAPYTIHPGQRLKLSPATTPAAVAGTRPTAPIAPPYSTIAQTSVPVHAASAPPAASTPMFEPVTAPAAASSGAKPPSSATVAAAPAVAAPPKPAMPATAATTSVVPVAGVKTPSPAVLPPPAPAQAVSTGPARAVSGVTWRWPAQGTLIKRFQPGDAIPGIEIGGNAGDAVRAAADGVVVYSGNGLVGYGELVIIKHSDSFLSAYGHNSKRLVKEGQRVTAGQQIAEMGSTGATRNELEFQIRKDGNPVDPLGYLPPH
ncbi:peptidoglycan DD-metalloendopeptidase family protein [Rhodanobacter sp. K2T2]|uniref:peptidoglycan DD-metalloendopeptidase family protein n=1 Tax=Rhodanobacter sp. K2T2 TaxID=2723085 RepID=UPI0021028DD2|nr:peptidoglycan DD-metalloendopeptidase family protein [Rhodanobacter sp. K2T2]